MRIAVIGTGYVGLVTGTCLAELGHEVTCVDIDAIKIRHLQIGSIPIYEPGLEDLVRRDVEARRLHFTSNFSVALYQAQAVFITVGTPPRQGDGFADITSVSNSARQIASWLSGFVTLVIKSTVPVGTGDGVEALIQELQPDADLVVVSNPEFLREGNAVQDFMHADRNVIGTNRERAGAVMREIYGSLLESGVPLVSTTRRSAELLRCAANGFLALKITYINENADLCDALGANVDDVASGMGLDRRMGAGMLSAGRGYGGSCFPKDTLALVRTAQIVSSPLRLLETAVDVNDAVDVNEQRVEAMTRRVVAACGGEVAGKTVAVLGLTFKCNTNDGRNAASLRIIPALQAAGAQVRAFDPEGMREARKYLSDMTFALTAYEIFEGADALLIITEWDQFRRLDLERLRSALAQPVVIDLRNLYAPEDMREQGFRYVSTGRPDELLSDPKLLWPILQQTVASAGPRGTEGRTARA